MNKLIKQLSYLGLSLLALISTFLGYSKLSAVALNNNPASEVAAGMVNTGLKGAGKDRLTFFEYIGDFGDKTLVESKFTAILSAIFLLIGILCVGIMLYTVLMSFIKRDGDTLNGMHIKWVSVAAFAACLISLLIAVIFPPVAEGFDYKTTIGVGSILFLIGTGLAAIFSFVHPIILKD